MVSDFYHTPELETYKDVVFKLTDWPIEPDYTEKVVSGLVRRLSSNYSYDPELVYEVLNDMVGRVNVGQTEQYIVRKFTRVMYDLPEGDAKLFYTAAKKLVKTFR